MGRLVAGRRAERLDSGRRGQDRQCIGVQHMLAMPLQHGHEHRVAAFGALHQHRRHDRHHHSEEALPAHSLAHLGEADRRLGPERAVVAVQQRVVMLTAVRDRQRATQEVGQIGHRRTPGNRLPINHGQWAFRTGSTEQQVVQAVVAVDQAVDTVFGRLSGQVAVESADQSLAHQPMTHRDLFAVAIEETGEQRGDQRLVDRCIAIEPRRVGEAAVT